MGEGENTGRVTVKQVQEELTARIDELAAQVESQGATIDEVQAGLGAIRAELDGVEESVRVRVIENLKGHFEARVDDIKQAMPDLVREQVLDIADTILWDGTKKAVKGIFTKIITLGGILGRKAVKEVATMANDEKERHQAAREGRTEEPTEEAATAPAAA